MVYSVWATTDQTDGIEQGFFFDPDTLEPRIGEGFKRAASMWKDIWPHGHVCTDPSFELGRCAIGYGPPGCWKGVFLNGVRRTATVNNVTETVWQPVLKSGEYAEPYRFKPFGSVDVVDRETGVMVPCTSETCPKAEVIPPFGHHGDDDRASVLPKSPLEGRLINRAPFYWSGGLGTAIRKSSTPVKKDAMWDFFVYTNSPETSRHDVASYSSWLDSWRVSQLTPGDNFREAGWSTNAYEEHVAIQTWGLSSEVNGAFNLRLPGVAKYTRDVMGDQMLKLIRGETDIDSMMEEVRAGWYNIHMKEGKLDQLATYRLSLGLNLHSEVELCHLHRALMDQRDPTTCRQYDPEEKLNAVVAAVVASAVAIVLALVLFVAWDTCRRRALEQDRAKLTAERDEILEVERLAHSDNRRVALSRIVVLTMLVAAAMTMSIWVTRILEKKMEQKYQNAVCTLCVKCSKIVRAGSVNSQFCCFIS